MAEEGIKAGTVADFTGSMAEAMENALRIEWVKVKGIAFPEVNEDDRRLMFVSIAQGVVRYLKDHAAEFMPIAVDVTQDADNNVGSSGTTDTGSVSTTPTGGGAGKDYINHTHVSSVTQTSGNDNRVTSTGAGILSLTTTGDLY